MSECEAQSGAAVSMKLSVEYAVSVKLSVEDHLESCKVLLIARHSCNYVYDIAIMPHCGTPQCHVTSRVWGGSFPDTNLLKSTVTFKRNWQ